MKPKFEKRKTTRADFVHPVILRKGSLRISGWLGDISLKGMYVKANRSLRSLAGKEVSYEIELAKARPKVLIRGRAKIVRQDNQGCGLNFLRMRGIDLLRIRRLLELNLFDTEKLRKELKSFIR